ncbi:hypothetical protein Tco_0272934 [Tanacetum coccineum]
MAMKLKLDADLSGEPVDQTDYHSKIGSLMYLTSSRSDIVHAICYCARYQARPTEKHLKEFLGDKLVSWISKKQDFTAMSSAEAEYMALSASFIRLVRLGIRPMIPPEGNPGGTTQGHSIARMQSLRSYALSWKPCQGDSLNLPDHSHIRPHALLLTVLFQDSYKDGDGDASFQLKSDSLPHAHAQTTKTYYKHQDSRIKKAQVLKTKTSANSDKQDLPLRYQVYQGRLLKSFQEDAKYEHVGRDTRSQSNKDDQDWRINI